MPSLYDSHSLILNPIRIPMFWQVSSINQLAELYTVVFHVKLTF
jgi:hypothetical protein